MEKRVIYHIRSCLHSLVLRVLTGMVHSYNMVNKN